MTTQLKFCHFVISPLHFCTVQRVPTFRSWLLPLEHNWHIESLGHVLSKGIVNTPECLHSGGMDTNMPMVLILPSGYRRGRSVKTDVLKSSVTWCHEIMKDDYDWLPDKIIAHCLFCAVQTGKWQPTSLCSEPSVLSTTQCYVAPKEDETFQSYLFFFSSTLFIYITGYWPGRRHYYQGWIRNLHLGSSWKLCRFHRSKVISYLLFFLSSWLINSYGVLLFELSSTIILTCVKPASIDRLNFQAVPGGRSYGSPCQPHGGHSSRWCCILRGQQPNSQQGRIHGGPKITERHTSGNWGI